MGRRQSTVMTVAAVTALVLGSWLVATSASGSTKAHATGATALRHNTAGHAHGTSASSTAPSVTSPPTSGAVAPDLAGSSPSPTPSTTDPVPPTTNPVPPTTDPVPPTTDPVPPTTSPVPDVPTLAVPSVPSASCLETSQRGVGGGAGALDRDRPGGGGIDRGDQSAVRRARHDPKDGGQHRPPGPMDGERGRIVGRQSPQYLPRLGLVSTSVHVERPGHRDPHLPRSLGGSRRHGHDDLVEPGLRADLEGAQSGVGVVQRLRQGRDPIAVGLGPLWL